MKEGVIMNYIIKALENTSIDNSSSNTTYYNKDGFAVPRVTEVLSTMIHSDALMYWANSLGFRGIKYKDALNKAANIGTYAHSAIEKFLKDKLSTDNNIPFLGFMMWYDIVTKDKGISVEVISIEHKMSCQWFGGTLDALLKIGGRVYLVDFKTSNHITYKYFLQLAAYRYMLKVVEGINIDGVIVLQLDKDEPGFNEYLLNFSIQQHLEFINHCETTFLSLLYGYYNIQQSERMFKTIFSKR
jgi:hypothetical protein